MALEHAYRQALPASRALFERAQHLFPDGVTHDNRRMQPFPIFVERADGAYKWDVDGRQYIDYWMGHGALIMGHNPPHVRDAVIEQAARGTHYGASHALEVSWAEWVCKLVPCAERVRFTASGTEATHMALRLARAYTGKRNVIKFAGHFHGWHEGLEVGVQTPYEMVPEPGQMQEAVDAVALCPPNDIEAVRAALAAGDVAAIILEPTGGHFGTVPVAPSFLQRLREEATRAGVVLIFDEVVTGFRVAPGGAQELYGSRLTSPRSPKFSLVVCLVVLSLAAPRFLTIWRRLQPLRWDSVRRFITLAHLTPIPSRPRPAWRCCRPWPMARLSSAPTSRQPSCGTA